MGRGPCSHIPCRAKHQAPSSSQGQPGGPQELPSGALAVHHHCLWVLEGGGKYNTGCTAGKIFSPSIRLNVFPT